jgi:hypothetical protein
LVTSNSQISFHTGLKPLSAATSEKNKTTSLQKIKTFCCHYGCQYYDSMYYSTLLTCRAKGEWGTNNGNTHNLRCFIAIQKCTYGTCFISDSWKP